jgi:ABC-2 type transport system permease protein
MFSSPLTIGEWIAAVMLLGAIRMFLIILFGSIVAWALYAFNVFAMGWALIPFALSLLLTGWALGFCTAAIILYGGMRVHWATWAMGALMSPFISIYYPASTLPWFGQVIAYLLPPTYVFEGMRKIIFSGSIPFDYLAISLLLNVLYLTLAILFFKHMFEKSRVMGLNRTE